MSKIILDAAKRPILTLPIYYEVSGHKVALDTFIETASQYKSLLGALNAELFEDQLQFKLYVLPAEQGSLRSKLGLAVVAGFGAICGPTLGDFGTGFINGLTGMPPVEWGEFIGERLRQEYEEVVEGDVPEDLNERLVGTHILVEASRSFLEATNAELAKLDIHCEELPDSFVAKNLFFEALDANPQVEGVRFGEEREIIPRDKYALRVSRVKPKEDYVWEFETKKYFVTSPNWDQEDQQRKWKARDAKGTTVYFTIYDPSFWNLCHEKKIVSHTIDELIVQVAVKVEEGRRKQRVVLNVISYNDDHLNREFGADSLSNLLSEAGLDDVEDASPSLFEDHE